MKIKQLKIIKKIGELGIKDISKFDIESSMPRHFKVPRIKIRGKL